MWAASSTKTCGLKSIGGSARGVFLRREQRVQPLSGARSRRCVIMSSLLSVHVSVHVTPGQEEAFRLATLDNASNSIKEAGVARFDVLRHQKDPGRFVLVEVYADPAAPAAHKQTEHYARWAAAVNGWMAAPRAAVRYTTVFPIGRPAWQAREGAAAEPAQFVVMVSLRAKPEHAAALAEATIANAAASLKEPKVLRFDFMRAEEDPCAFALCEVYTDKGGFDDHLRTAHFAAWKAAVPDGGMLAEPFAVVEADAVFPLASATWKGSA